MGWFKRGKAVNDNWPPTANVAAMQARADVYRAIRHFFDAQGVLEVDTPHLAHFGVTDLHIDNIAVDGYGYLQSSPEYHMKRLLAAGIGSCWQLAHVYRDSESGRRHNPEFTLLEWYRLDFSLHQLIAEVVALLWQLLPDIKGTERIAFRDAFARATGLDPLTASRDELDSYARQKDKRLPELDKPALVDWLMATEVEAAFNPNQLTIVTDFPVWAAALAEIAEDRQGSSVAQRFEVYAAGVELANGYQELRDAKEQRQRFEQDQLLRQQANKAERQIDPWLMAAMEAGLPPVSGVAMGIDRLLMIKLGAKHIDEVIAFPWQRA